MSKNDLDTESVVERQATYAEIRRAIEALDQAFISHIQWGDALNVTLVCRLRPDERDMRENAHRECLYGQWYYGQKDCILCQNRNFQELEHKHQLVHERAAHLLKLLSEDRNIPTLEYVEFNRELDSLRQQTLTLKQDLESKIYNIDALTGAKSRIGMLALLEEQHERARRQLETSVIAMMDIDKFKLVNDRYGHLVGDRALVRFAEHVKCHTRPFDELFRYGGEEFLLCAPHTDIDTAHGMIERIRIGLSEIDILCDEGSSFRITASFGLTVLDPDVPVAECINRSDLATYAAKQRGRNQTVIWNPSIEHRWAS